MPNFVELTLVKDNDEVNQMFDSDLCARSIGKWPVIANWQQFHGLQTLLLIGLFLLILCSLGWIFRQLRQKRRFSRPKAFFVLLGLTAALPLVLILAAQGMVAFLPQDSGAPADAIVVLGRGTKLNASRAEVVAELWQAQRAPRIFASGRGDSGRIIQLLEAKGILSQALDGENCSITTEENALFTASILQPRGVKRVVLVTDPPHMMRSLLAFQAIGFEAIPHLSPLPSYLRLKAKTFLSFRELVGLVAYGLQGRFFPERSPEQSRPDLGALFQQAVQYGEHQKLP